MLRIRRFEEAVIRIGEEFPGHRHVGIGQEATAVAVALARRPQDPVFSTHRNHAHNVALGADPGRLMAELYGKAAGYAGGKAGSFHAAATERGLVAASGIVGGNLGVAVGAGWGLARQGKDGVAIALFGDGATNEGAFHEATNLAVLWNVPVVLICENNTSGDLRRSIGLAAETLETLAKGYAIPFERADGHSVEAMVAALCRACDRARCGDGPTLVEAAQIRWPGSGGAWPHMPWGPTPLGDTPPNADPAYRAWDAVDPLRRFLQEVRRHGWISEERIQAADAAIRAEMDEAVAFARQSPWPTPDALTRHVFANP